MTTPQMATDFLQLLAQSELLPPDQVDAVARRCRTDADSSPAEMARQLIKDGRLTRFQAQRLLDGHYRGFFIDHYKLLEVLGTGGMGGVYVAEDTRTGENVALKVLSERHRHDSGMLTRLKLEARAGLRLRHPHIVRTDSIGHTGAVDYLVMEYVRGITLQELITLSGPRPWPQACDFICQAADALHHAHRKALVHRDIKPANLLVQHDGTVKILDFGLALIKDERDDEFSLSMIFGHDCLGSADYIAPEQSLDSSAVDARADIYSLGCTLYSALSGSLPFPLESSSAMLEAHRTQRPRPIRELAPDVPGPVGAVLDRMMCKDSRERYPTAEAVRRALQPFARRDPVDFDFSAVLKSRAKEARRRTTALRRIRTRSRAFDTTATGPQNSTGDSQQAGRPSSRTWLRDEPVPEAASSTSTGKTDSGEGSPPVRPIALEAAPVSPSAASHPETPPTAQLLPLDGGAPHPVIGPSVTLGREADCQIPLPFSGISGRHCELRQEGGWWRIIDLDSKNGIRVNGTKVTERMLWDDDVLTLAEHYHFRFHVGGAKSTSRRIIWSAVSLAALAGAAAAGAAAWWLL